MSRDGANPANVKIKVGAQAYGCAARASAKATRPRSAAVAARPRADAVIE
jgi:hypothetical protein